MLNILENRKSIRDFKEEKVKEEDLKKIVEVALRAPTYANTQVVSLVVVKDEKRKEELAKLSGNQKHMIDASAVIVVVMDFYRSKKLLEDMNENLGIINDVESLLVGSIDAGLVLSQLQTAAHTLGYGTTVIGGIRLNSDKVIELLNLPKYTYPVIATTIGVPKDNLPKTKLPRLDIDGTVFYETYDKEKSFMAEKKYIGQFNKYCEEIKVNLTPFDKVLINYFKFGNGRSKTTEFIKKQGFDIEF